MIYANNLEVNYEVVKPEELNPKERAGIILMKFYKALQRECSAELHSRRMKQAEQLSLIYVQDILRLPLIGSGRMQPENLSDLKYWKDVLSELEKM